MESKLGFQPRSCRSSAGTTGTTLRLTGNFRMRSHPGAKLSYEFARGNPPYGRQAFSQACDRERTAAAHGGAELTSRLEK